MAKVIWILPLLGALAGVLTILLTLGSAGSAPQQAAGYAMACAFAVVPYVLAKAAVAMLEDNWQRDIKRIAAALEKRKAEA